MPLKLFLEPGACSLSPHIALEEAGLPDETESGDLARMVARPAVRTALKAERRV